MDETAASSGAPRAAAGERAEKMMPELKVVVAVDASDESLHALSWALDNVVRPNPDAALVVVHAQRAVEHLAYPLAVHGTRKSSCIHYLPLRQRPVLTLGIIWRCVIQSKASGTCRPRWWSPCGRRRRRTPGRSWRARWASARRSRQVDRLFYLSLTTGERNVLTGGAGGRQGCHCGGRRQGGHLPGRGADAGRPPRPRLPGPRKDQEVQYIKRIG
jgi:hypothetical protein